LLAPWPNRIAGGVYCASGISYTLPAGDGRGNSLHGLVFDRAARVERLSDSKATLVSDIEPVEGYPFQMEVRSTFELFEDEIRINYSMKNLSNAEAPAGIGAHPYFPFDENTMIEVLASSYSVHGKDMIPVEERNISDLQLGRGVQKLVQELELDTQFSKFSGEVGGVIARLIHPTFAVEVTQEPVGWAMLYTAKNYPWQKGLSGAIAIEPQTCAVDAFNNGKGVMMLKPGEALDLSWGVRLLAA
jgi:aldose 1-epimerase